MKINNKQLKQIIKEELNKVLNEMSGGGLDVLKPQMDQKEYKTVSDDIKDEKDGGWYIRKYVMALEEAYRPNRFYAKAGFPGMYWTKIAEPFAYQKKVLNQEYVQKAKQEVIKDPSVFTPTGLGRVIAILEFLDESSGGIKGIDKDVF